MKSKFRYLVALGLALASLATLAPTTKVSATRPTSAIVEALSGAVRMRSRDNAQSSAIQPFVELPISTILDVPGTRRGSMEHWIHLRFKNGSSRSLTLVQAGTDPVDSQYRFPCEYQQGTGLWGLRQVGGNACDRIMVNVSGWRSQRQPSILAQTPESQILRYFKIAVPTPIAQQVPGQLSITPANTLTLIYIYQTAEGVVVNVLTGAATIRSTAGSTIVRSGIQYIDSGDGRRGKTDPIPQEVYSARAVEIFLDPNTWANDTQRQIIEFQDAVTRQREGSIPRLDPGTVFIPPSPTPRPSRPTDSDSTPGQTPDSRPDSTPDEPSDSVPPSDSTVDYGDYVRPSPSPSPVIR